MKMLVLALILTAVAIKGALLDESTSEATITTPSGGNLTQQSDATGTPGPLFQMPRKHDHEDPGVDMDYPNSTVHPGLYYIRQYMLTEHNWARMSHGVRALVGNSALDDAAQRWAMHLARTGKLHNSPTRMRKYKGQETGESVMQNFDISPGTIDEWYAEIIHYDFGKPKFDPRTARFTQIVWRNTTQLGVGASLRHSPLLTTYIVVRYFPAGNVEGKFKDNVVIPMQKVG